MDMLRKMKMRTKLLAGFCLVSIVTLVVGFFGISKIHQIDDADTFLYEKVTVPMSEIADVAVAFQRIRVNMAVLVGTADKDTQKQMVEGNIKLREVIQEKLPPFEKTLQTEEEKKLFADLLEARREYIKVTDQVMELASAGKMEAAQDLLQGDAREVANRYRKDIDDMMESMKLRGQRVAADNTATAQGASRLMYTLMGLAFLASIGFGMLITRDISAQLGEDPGYLAEVAGKIAGGDLNVAFRPQKTEGGVYHVMQGMVATMKGKIAEADQKSAEAAEQARLAGIATDEANRAKAAAERAKAEGMIEAASQLEKVVEVISSASEELSAQVEQSSRGTEVQATRVADTATAMEEMNSTVLEVARNASQAAESTDAARRQAGAGSTVVSQVVAGIGTMQTVSLSLKQDMGQLGRQAEGIGQVMNVISDIADQTNLLALNAAIEAARAGDAGRGFAVVADEVRKLAEKTMTATREVGEAIRGIQEGARKNMDNVDRAVSTVEEATKLANESGEALRQIVALVDTATDQVRSIATASEQQSATSEEINRSIEEINRISSETSDAMRQSAQAVGELASQTQSLRALIERMKSGA
ncbi:methyl-accepting chemotaxis protein [Humidesulfovibrio sp.]